MFTQNANKIFDQVIDDYHRYDDVDHQPSNPYAEGTIDHLLYMKNWVDTVQWSAPTWWSTSTPTCSISIRI